MLTPKKNANETEVFYQVTGAAKLLGDLQGASELKKRVNAFNELRSEIEFVVVPDGAIYREGLGQSTHRQLPGG